MRKEDFFDLLGNIEDKFYLEAMCEEPLEAVPVYADRRGRGFGKIAAALAATIGITASAALLLGKGAPTQGEGTGTAPEKNSEITSSEIYSAEALAAITDLNRTVSPEVKVTVPTKEQITAAMSHILAFENGREGAENEIYGNVYGKIRPEEDLYCYTVDLNFDNIEEIVLASWEHSEIFIFELKEGNVVLNSVIKKKNAAFTIDEESFCRLAPYYGEDNTNIDYPDGECFYYFYGSFYEGGQEGDSSEKDVTSAFAAAIKYDKETNSYRSEFLMSYAGQMKGEKWETVFAAPSASKPLSAEDFEKLWYGYDELPALVFRKDIEYCKKYAAENYDELLPPDKRGYFSEFTEDELSFYVKDFNLDGNLEIAVVSWEHSPVFVFGHTAEGFVYDAMIGNDKIRSYLNSENFSEIAAYEGEEEKYLYYYFVYNDYGERSRNMGALKYDPEKGGYYVEHYLVYGMKSEDGEQNWEPFYQKTVLGKESEDMSYEEFSRLWNRHKGLEAVSVDNFVLKVESF